MISSPVISTNILRCLTAHLDEIWKLLMTRFTKPIYSRAHPAGIRFYALPSLYIIHRAIPTYYILPHLQYLSYRNPTSKVLIVIPPHGRGLTKNNINLHQPWNIPQAYSAQQEHRITMSTQGGSSSGSRKDGGHQSGVG